MSSETNGGAAKPPRKRPTFFRTLTGWLIAFIILPAGWLALCEGILRIAGYGQSLDPFLARIIDGETVYVRNKAFMDQFFDQPFSGDRWQADIFSFAVPKTKANKVYRIFVFGSSAAMGWPEGKHSFSSLLNLMLTAAYPDVRFEVYNCAAGGANSHVMRTMAEACAQLNPDAFFVYMGNNEFHGPYGVLSKFRNNSYVASSKTVQRLIRWNQLRLFQGMHNANGWWAKHGWRSPFIGLQETVRPDSPLADRACENFRENLAAICDSAKHAGAPVFISTVGANLRHWPPTKPQHLGRLSDGEMKQWDQGYEQGEAEQKKGNFAEALSAFRRSEAIEEEHAGLQFHLGECYWQDEDYESARVHFTRAMDLDTFLWVRCKTRINDIIRGTAPLDGANVHLVDAAQYLSQASPHGIPGAEFFLDSCHLNFKGNYLIAQAFFAQLEPRLPQWIQDAARASSESVSPEECAQFLGFTPEERLNVLKALTEAMEKTGKVPIDNVQAEIAALQNEHFQETPEDTLQNCRAAALRCTHHPEVRVRLIQELIAAGQLDEAFEQASSFAEELPYHKQAQRLLALAMFKLHRYEAAAAHFDRALQLYPDDVNAYLEYAAMRIENGEAEQAILLVQKALCRADSFSWSDIAKGRVISVKGDVLESTGDLNAAIQTHFQAIELNPAGCDSYRALDRIYVASKNASDRESLWRQMTEKHPEQYLSWYFLGKTMDTRNDWSGAMAAYEQAMKISPGNLEVGAALSTALNAKGAALLDAGQTAQALELFQRAQSFSANQAAAEFGIGRALEIKGELEAAVQAYLRAIEQAPVMLDPYDALAQTYAAHAHLGDIEALWREMTDKHPDRMWPWYFLGLALERKNDWDGAISAYENALKVSPENVGARTALAEALCAKAAALLDAGENSQALELFRRAQSFSGKLLAAEFGTGRALEAKGEVDAAVQAYLRAIELDPLGSGPYESLAQIYTSNKPLGDAQAVWREMTDKHPERSWPWHFLGRAREQQSDWDGAIAAYEQSLKASSENSASSYALGRVLSAKGLQLLEAGENTKALELFSRAHALSDKQPEAMFGIGRALESLGELDKAADAYLQATEITNAEFGSYEALNRIYAAHKSPEQVEAIWREMTEKHPERTWPWHFLGLALEGKNDLDGAIAAYEQSLKASSENQGTAQVLSRVLSAKAMKLLEAREYDQALELFRRAQSISAAQPEAAFGIGRVLESTGKIEEAAQAYLQAVEFAPAWYDPCEALDRIYAANNNLGDIEALWRTRTDQHPDHHLAWFCLGLARERKDDLDGAIAAYEQSLKIVPGASGTQQALDRAKQAKARTSNNQ